MVNPFYIEPGGDYTQGLQGLAGALGQLGQQLTQANQFRSQSTKDNYVNSIFEVLQNPDNVESIVRSRQAFLKTQGEGVDSTSTDSFMERYRQDPKGTLKKLEIEAAVLDPQKYKTYKAATTPSTDEPTGNIKDFSHYQTLLRENPSEAAKFANQVGISTTPANDKTTAIKEFEYGEKNPKFLLAQQKKLDAASTKSASEGTFKDSTTLRKEFLSQSKDYQKVRDSYTRVIGSTQDPSPAGDLSLIFNYMKMLDPGSVVRESEFRTAASAGSYGDRIQASVQKILSGERLSSDMRQDFVQKASVLLKGMEDQHTKRAGEYTKIALSNNLPVDEVVVDITAPSEEDLINKPVSEMTLEERLRTGFPGVQ